MSQTLERFVDRLRVAARSRGKVVNLTIEEAQDAANALALLLLRENELLREISELKSQAQVTSVVIGGGSFAQG